jgi:hypothetical protein
MDVGTLEGAAEELRRRRRRAVEAAVLGAVASVLAGGALLVSSTLAVALAAGAALQTAIALAVADGRRELIARLALDPSAYVLAEVHRYGTRVAGPSRRARLAAWLFEVASEATLPGTLYLRDRVTLVANELEALAHELGSAISVQPATVVACERLLTRPTESPLYNPRLPADDLRLALRRIRANLT